MGKVVPLQRQSLTEMLAELGSERGQKARGIVSIILDTNGGAGFRISGFHDKGDSFYICGLLDWIKADLLHDMVID